ncbi:MAG: anthranilate phosphoribosyltransferase [Candidatus Hadarchaeales archaeon]
MLQEAIKKLVEFQDLTEEEARGAMREIMTGSATPAQIASFLTALRMKGEKVEEIFALAQTMREFSLKVRPRVGGRLVDTCGTGGDKIKTFNISTCSMFVAAGSGVKIAKHGNRSVTSKAGSADVLEFLGARIDLGPEGVERCIEEVGVGFMFAPVFHPSMKHALGPRREIGVRTVFNILGPLTNPAGAKGQLLGVYHPSLTEIIAGVLRKLGVERAMVVHGLDGLDELSTLGKSKVSELRSGELKTYEISPEQFNLPRARAEDLLGAGVEENAKILLQILKGHKGPKRDIVLLNSAAAIWAGALVDDLGEGIELAAESIDSGSAYRKLVDFIACTGGDLQKLRALEYGLS